MRSIFFVIIVFSQLGFAMAGNPVRPFGAGTKFFWNYESLDALPDGYDVYGVDLDQVVGNPGVVERLHAEGKKVSCYFSAGTWENKRKIQRYSKISESSKGAPMSGWDERWIDIRKSDVRSAQVEILRAAMRANCDAVEPDNVDHYDNKTGFDISEAESISYLQWLAKTAHWLKEGKRQGIKILLKNAQKIIPEGQLEKYFDFTLNEQCFTYGQCENLSSFTKENKGVFIMEYWHTHESDPYPIQNFSTDCKTAKKNDFFFIVYNTQIVNGDVSKECK